MRRLVISIVAATAMAGMLCGGAWGKLTPEQAKTAETLIKQCGDQDFQSREDAVRKLIEMGPDVLDMVKKAGEATKDAEVKTRCEMVVKTLAETTELGPVEGTKVTLDFKDAPIEKVVKELSRQSGNQELTIEKGLAESKVTVNVKDTPYWQAVEAVCKSIGACYAGKESDMPMVKPAGVTIMGKPEQTVELAAQAGAAMVIMGGVRRTNSNYVDLHLGQGGPEPSSTRFDLQVYLEDRLPMTRVSVRMTNVTTADGVNHARPAPVGMQSSARIATGNVGSFWRTSDLWDNTGEWPSGQVTLDGVLELSYGTEAKELRIPNAADAKNVEVTGGGIKLKLLSMTITGQAGGIAFITLEDPADQGIAFMDGRGKQWGFFLVDPDGKRYPGVGVMMLNAGVAMQKTVVFVGAQGMNDKWSLIYAYPGKVVNRSYPFSIIGVPIP